MPPPLTPQQVIIQHQQCRILLQQLAYSLHDTMLTTPTANSTGAIPCLSYRGTSLLLHDPDTACLVHHWLFSFNLSFNLPPPTWPSIYIQDYASSFISVLSLVHYPDKYQAYCPRWIIHIRCQSMDHYFFTAQEARENLLLLLRYTTPTVLLLYNNLSNDCVSSGRGLLHWGMGASRTGYPDPSSHKTRNIWQVSNHEGV